MHTAQKILITGGAGFIGSAVIRYLIKDTHHHVVNVDKLTYAGNLNSVADASLSHRYQFIHQDICNQAQITKILQQTRPDFILHLAAESHVDRSIDDPSQFIQTNILGTFSLLEATKDYWSQLNNERRARFRFHHVSTDEVYGDLSPTDPAFSETSPYAPSSPYSASKASADHLVRAWLRTFGLPVIISHCSNNYGPYQFPEKLIPHTILSALRGSALKVYGNGEHIRDWLYVDDHAKALIQLLHTGRVGDTYNIGGHSEKRNIDVVYTICALLEEFAPIKPKGIRQYTDLIQFVTDRPGHDRRYAVDSRKIKQELNWAPTETFSTGLRQTVRWYLNNTDWWEEVLNGNYQLKRQGQYSL